MKYYLSTFSLNLVVVFCSLAQIPTMPIHGQEDEADANHTKFYEQLNSIRTNNGKSGLSKGFGKARSDYRSFDEQIQSRAEEIRNSTNPKTIKDSFGVSGFIEPRHVQFYGPRNVGGRTRALLIDALDQERVFAAAATGGVWQTKRYSRLGFGAKWKPLNDHSLNLATMDIVQNPWKPKQICYVTGECIGFTASGKEKGFPGIGLFISNNRGKEFNSIASTAGDVRFRHAWCVQFAKPIGNKPSRLFVGTNRHGLLFSSNNGKTWKCAFADGHSVTDLLVLPNGNMLAAVAGVGIFRWNGKSKVKFKKVGTNYPTDFDRICLASCDTKPNFIYAAFSFKSKSLGIRALWKSDNGGLSWTPKKTTGIGGNTQYRFCLMLGIHPRNPEKLIVGTKSPYFSKDGGETWKKLPIRIPDYHAFANFGDDRFLIANDRGIYEGDWFNIEKVPVLHPRNQNYHTTQFYGGDIFRTKKDKFRVLGGAQDNGALVLDKKWNKMIASAGGDGVDCHYSQYLNGKALIAGAFTIGQTKAIQVVSNVHGLDPDSRPNHFPLEMTKEKFQFLNAYTLDDTHHFSSCTRTDEAIWRTRNIWAADPWERITEGKIPGIQTICHMDSDLYFGGLGSQFFRQPDYFDSKPGDEINLSSTVPHVGAITCIETSQFAENELLVGFGDESKFIPAPSKIFRVKNPDEDSIEWISIGQRLPENLPVYSIGQLHNAKFNLIFVGTEFGVYYTGDQGLNWWKCPQIPNTPVLKIRTDRQSNSIFVFTYGRGIWTIQLPSP